MSFPRYEKYKDSGVAWLGEVPEHWEVRSIKFVISKIDSGTSVNAIDESAQDHEIGVLKTSCVYSGIFNPAENKTVIEQEIGRITCPLKADTLIVSRMNTPDLIGAAGLVTDAPMNIYLPDRLWQVSFSDTCTAFIYFWTQTLVYKAYIKSVCVGTSSSMQNLSQDQFRSFILALPTFDEQFRIAEFLQNETTKIDELIAEQQQLIELLKEKRQAVISHAVTKGLNPDAPMKDSGIKWLGEVPEHWEITLLKHIIANIESGISVNSTDTPVNGDEYGVLKTSCVYNGEFDAGQNKAIVASEYDRASCPLRLNSLIVSRMNTPDLVGAAGLVRQERSNLFLPDRLWQVTFYTANPAFVHYWTLTTYYRSQVKMVCTGTSSSMQNLGQDQFRSFIFPLPLVQEQSTIAAFLDRETAKFDELIAEAQRAIELLKERRTALISAAVTGKIDVRGLVADKRAV
ncbi:MAG: restriction endonuclease subunit S [Nitrosomonas sp.]|nr:restriction endonuclease subunit S [Nitrosomonas sp.]